MSHLHCLPKTILVSPHKMVITEHFKYNFHNIDTPTLGVEIMSINRCGALDSEGEP